MKVFLYILRYEKEPYFMGKFFKFNTLKNLNNYLDSIKDDLKQYGWKRCVITRVIGRNIEVIKEIKVTEL